MARSPTCGWLGLAKTAGCSRVTPVHPDDGGILGWEHPHQAGDGHLSVDEAHWKFRAPIVHVIVGHDVTVAVIDNSRPSRSIGPSK